MATLNVQVLETTGTEVTFDECDALGDEFVNNGHIHLRFKNADTAPKTITINSQKPCNYGVDHDLSITVPAGKTYEIPVLDTYRFNDTDNKVQITYSAVTNLTIAVVQAG